MPRAFLPALPPSVTALTALETLDLRHVSYQDSQLVEMLHLLRSRLWCLTLGSARAPSQALLDGIAALPRLSHVSLEFEEAYDPPALLRPGPWCSGLEVLGASWRMLGGNVVSEAAHLQQLHLLGCNGWEGGEPSEWRTLLGCVERRPTLRDVCFELLDQQRLHPALFELALELSGRCPEQSIRRTRAGTSFQCAKFYATCDAPPLPPAHAPCHSRPLSTCKAFSLLQRRAQLEGSVPFSSARPSGPPCTAIAGLPDVAVDRVRSQRCTCWGHTTRESAELQMQPHPVPPTAAARACAAAAPPAAWRPVASIGLLDLSQFVASHISERLRPQQSTAAQAGARVRRLQAAGSPARCPRTRSL